MRNWFRRRDGDPLEAKLREQRPEPPADLVDSILGTLSGQRRPASPRAPRLRAGLALAMTVVMLGALATLGGLGYASSAIHQTAASVQHLVSPPHAVVSHDPQTPANRQYCPDPDHDCEKGEHHHKHHHHKHHHHHHHHHHDDDDD